MARAWRGLTDNFWLGVARAWRGHVLFPQEHSFASGGPLRFLVPLKALFPAPCVSAPHQALALMWSCSSFGGCPETVVGKLDYFQRPPVSFACPERGGACGGSDRGAKAGIPRSLAPTRDKMRKLRNCQKREFDTCIHDQIVKKYAFFESTCLDTVSANRTPRMKMERKGAPRPSLESWTNLRSHPPPPRAPGPPAGWGRTRGARRGFARRE
eukprot:gene10503-biopygen22822